MSDRDLKHVAAVHVRTYDDFRCYSEWVRAYDTVDDADRQMIRNSMRRFPRSPLFSLVLLPASDGAVSSTQASTVSVLRQLYPHWELWLPRGADSANLGVDPRVRIMYGNIALSAEHADMFNAALAAAKGDFVLPLPTGAILAEHALYELAAAVVDHPEAELLYTDEDRVSTAGDRCMPRFKTAWDPDLALGRDAIGLLVAYHKMMLEMVSGMRPSSQGVDLALYELSLRVAFAVPPTRIHHVPAVLCHRRGSSECSLGWDSEGGREIVRKHLVERGVAARVLPAPLAPAWNRVVRDLPDPAPLVSVIVPTRDRAELLERSADAVLSRTDYPKIELLVVDNDNREPRAIGLLQRLSHNPRVRILRCSGAFNYSALNNAAAREARGDILVLLNDDTDVIRPDWLREMVSHAIRPDVGAVGAKLLYPDGRVQHAGVVLGPGREIVHQLRFSDRSGRGPNGELALTRTVSAVTGACLAIRRSVFFQVGGLDENLRVAFNDIDLCMRLGDYGYRIVWTPFAELLHHEAASRGFDTTPEKQAIAISEHAYFCRFWKTFLEADPFRSPNVVYGWDTVTLSQSSWRERLSMCCFNNRH